MYVRKYTQKNKTAKIVHAKIHKNTKSQRWHTQIYTSIQNCKEGTQTNKKGLQENEKKKLQTENKKRDTDCHESGHKNTNASAEILIIDHPYCMNETFAICMTMVQW